MRRASKVAVSVCVLVAAACGGQQARPETPDDTVLQMAAPAPAAPPDTAFVQQPKTAPVAAADRPKLEVVFALDTTGSMSGLIDGAKQKIWSIADELASAQPTPELRIGLIAYRDRGDSYVTQRFPLTDDIDVIYQQLHSLHADGGGDEPESVNQALYEAVHGTPWSQDTRTYRAVFLVGDAPPHMDYQDDVKYTDTVREAAERGIVVNTVQCGNSESTRAIWAAIADNTRGSYAAIQQDGGMLQIAAPMDDEINRLNAALSATVVPYGEAEQVESTRRKASMAAAAPAAASASRHAYLGKKGGGVVTGRGDLVDDVKSGRVKLESLKPSELPAELRDLDTAERKVVLAKQGAERAKLQARLDHLVRERGEYVRREEEKRREAGSGAGFDGEVMRAVKAQAESAAGVTYAR
jgi:Mg-chelatase subunit ChlD